MPAPIAPPGYVHVCALKDTLTHTRFQLSLRTLATPVTYHRLLLFRIAKPSEDEVEGADELYCMEESCPHLGAPLSHAEIEVDDIEDTRAVVCPWHQYDFDLRDGTSSTGLKTCTYDVVVNGDGPNAGVWIEAPHVDGDHDWEMIEFRSVSEEFADPPPLTLEDLTLEVPEAAPSLSPEAPIVAATLPTDLPDTLLGFAHLVLATPEPGMKCALTREAVTRMRAGKLKSIRPSYAEIARARKDGGLLEKPPRLQEAVRPWQTSKRGRGGSEKSRIVMIHALANIEQYAIDLAWDIIARFADTEVEGQRLPVEFFLDWAKVAEDEAKHYSLLARRLHEMGSYFGAHSVHAGLWDSAMDTADSLLARIAVIHLVAEARGVDMNPLTLARLRTHGDTRSADILEIIHADEITHVTAGHRWFSWICGKRNIDPIEQFRYEVRTNFHGDLKGPFNTADRAKAGLTEEYYTDLKGHGVSRHAAYDGAGPDGGDTHMHPRLT
ncbi:hypothetical protein CcaverHIS002_0107900 [Cutaneotrichosporon cavernicola]|uniref:Rieske domain-containing protein n=1 Tax=Cutaneotrichosporon cavernicola TaxID=279322 RepID=A0AA48I8D3_9TREE|nr:uncharacterized protein CcaverHIS019_0107850 [Cutaneotrichosporon cavernicola]BEI80261.1 hypothetical protein CcaverHIS002_0107900 [Cutaneotrichosporon cavernicola]BEI88067.1 hypothetical protein CcaverHIS019_0107850 [Cutaneotrichosporon cavernicola]BEI95838.1 hypothetical protein CcaverHIS631_0107870 [Cutaneotrichosporon cavernicola]BEJ03612.1 hypothetical protein CcaverHIS641_0107870 [Cutaneotrichosporon cavernicola]